MKIGSNKLKMSDGSVRTFKSKQARDNFEKVARAVKHGFEPTRKKSSSSKTTGSKRRSKGKR